jgi:hypothetical protein
MTTIDAATTLDLAKDRRDAKDKVDREAEAERQRRAITPGDGQQLEYKETAAEAFDFATDSDPAETDYPMLVAERDAQNEANGTSKTLSEIAQEVRNHTFQWRNQHGAAIKKQRRKAKMLIDQADNPKVIWAEADIDWTQV